MSREHPLQFAGVWTTLLSVLRPENTVIGRPLCAMN
jgi:hypothetical protein